MDGIEIGQTYRVTEAGLKVKSGWNLATIGDVFYIRDIGEDTLYVEELSQFGVWNGAINFGEIAAFERVGVHPNFAKHLTKRLLNLRERKQQAEWDLERLPSDIKGYIKDIARLEELLEQQHSQQ